MSTETYVPTRYNIYSNIKKKNTWLINVYISGTKIKLANIDSKMAKQEMCIYYIR